MRQIIAAILVGMLIWVGSAFAQSIPTWPEFTLSQRDGFAGIETVPVFRGTAPNTITALDLSPNGNPTEISAHGFAWMDICDKDLTTLTGTTPFHCARVGMSSQGSRFGTLSFSNAPLLPVLIVSNSNTLAKFYLDTTNHAKLIVGTTDVLQEIADLKARVYALEH